MSAEFAAHLAEGRVLPADECNIFKPDLVETLDDRPGGHMGTS